MSITPPGPPSLPIFGNLLAFRHRRLAYLMSLPAYGDITFARFGNQPVYTLHHPRFIRQVLVDDAENYHKLRLTRNMFQQVLSQDDVLRKTQAWQQRRELVQSAFHTRKVETYAQTMIAETQAWLQQWQSQQEIEIYQQMRNLAFNIVCKTIFGTHRRDDAQDIMQATHILQVRGSRRFNTLISVPLWLPTPNNIPVKRAIRTLHDFIQSLMDDVLHAESGRDDVLALLVLQATQNGVITESQIREELISLLVSGHETTATALSWVLYLLGTHPEIRRIARQEVKDVIGNAPLQFQHLSQLTYIEAVIKESMRLYPPAWTISRRLVQETTLGNYTIPRDATIFINPYSLHRDERWFAAPLHFKPERFLDETIQRYTYIPFSMGARKCLGDSFAMMETQIILSMILQQYDLELIAGQKIVPAPLISLRPAHGIRMMVNVHV